VLNIYFLHGLSFVKVVPLSNICIVTKGALLNFAMGTILHKCATVLDEFTYFTYSFNFTILVVSS